MTTLAELKVKADNLGLDRGIVRLYGDLRKIETWERAITSHQTVTVEAVEIADTVADKIDKDEIDKNEIIPFIPEVDLAECNDRKSTMLFEVQRQRAIFEKKQAIDCPPPPPPAPIVRPCPIPERRDIPGVEIAETSPPPGHGRGDERLYPPDFNPHIDSIAEKATKMRAMFKATYPDEFKAMFPRENLGDRLFEKIKSDILRYFEGIKEDLEYCFELNYLENEDHYKEILSLVGLMEWNINNKHSIYDIWNTVPYFQREGFQKLIPFGIHEIFKDACLDPSCWECTRETYWLVIEKPAPIPTLSEPYGGIFIPNKMHELGFYIYLWKFPGMVEAENFFDKITDARKYCMVPAKSDLKIFNQPVLVGV